jgi:hypothetical protein
MNSYLKKIEAERIVLGTVNDRYRNRPLHGLSAGAIASWVATGVEAPHEMVEDLNEIGKLVGAMCERSGERLDQPEIGRLASVKRSVLGFRSRYR